MIDNALKSLIESVAGTGVLASPASSPITFTAGSSARIAYTALGGPRGYTDDGRVGVAPGRYQLDIVAESIITARTIAAKLMAKSTATPAGLDGYKGTVDGTKIEWISFPDLPRAGGTVQLRTEGGSASLARLMLDVAIVYRD